MTLAFTPLYDPLPALFPAMDDYWLWLVVPLVVAISLVYKGTRVAKLQTLAREAAVMSLQILLLMGVAAMALSAAYWVAVRAL